MRKHKQKRTIIPCQGVNKRTKWGGGQQKIYGFSLDDLEDLYNVSRKTINRLMSSGKLDPTSLKSIVDNYVALVTEQTRHNTIVESQSSDCSIR